MIPALRAGDLVDLQVTENRGEYHVEATMLVDAQAKYVRSVLTDFVHIYRLNPLITESEILPSLFDEIVRVRTRIVGCISFFCNEFELVEDVSQFPSGDLRAMTVPELSDFKSGRALWRIQPLEDRTRVVYEAHMEPDFFIPPLVGSYFVKKQLRESVTTFFTKLELISNVFAKKRRSHRPYFTSVKRETDGTKPLISFRDDVYPILADNCLECHATPQGKGYKKVGLNMQTYETLVKGSAYGQVIVPGDSEHSVFNMLVEGRADASMRMPHERTEALTDRETEVLRLWVDQGALNN